MVGFCTVLRLAGTCVGLLGGVAGAIGDTGAPQSAELAGDWVGSATTGSAKAGVFLSLVREGTELHGTLSTSLWPSGAVLENLQFSDDDLTFEIHDGSDHALKYHLQLSCGMLSGQATAGEEVSTVTLAPAPSVRSYPAIAHFTSAPELIHIVQPEYTKEARAALLEGTVELRVWVDPDGRVSPQRIRVLHGLGMGLDAQAVEAVKQWRLTPAYRNGKPVPVPVTIAVSFRLFQ